MLHPQSETCGRKKWLEGISVAGVALGELGQPVEGGLFGLVSPSDQKTVGKVVCELQHNFCAACY